MGLFHDERKHKVKVFFPHFIICNKHSESLRKSGILL